MSDCNDTLLELQVNAMRLFSRIFCLCLIIPTLIIHASGTPTPEPPTRSNAPIPYIYYYSTTENAFVVERADGTDSRLLAQDVMPDDYEIIEDVKWSPSGEWVAWRGRIFAGPGHTPTKVWITSTDGRKRVSLLDDAYEVRLIAWSPKADLLFVIYETRFPTIITTFSIIDVPNERLVTELTNHTSGYIDLANHHPSTIYNWDDNGTSIYFKFAGMGTSTVTRLDIDGRVENWWGDQSIPLTDFNRGRLLHQVVSIEKRAYVTDLVLTDVITGEQKVFQRVTRDSSPIRRGYEFYWSQRGTVALTENTSCVEYNCTLDSIDLFQWETGERSTLPNALFLVECGGVSRCSRDWLWSPDEQFAVLQDVNGHLNLLEAATGKIYPVINEKVEDWIWLPNGDLMLVQAEYQGIARYDRQTHTLIPIIQFDTRIGWGLFLSQDGAFAGFTGINQVIIQNLETGERRIWPRHSATTGAGPVTDFNWHDSGQWFFSGGNTQIIDSCCNSKAIMIHRVGETSRRELTQCYGIKSCVGFLPDHVLPHLTPGQETSLTPAPLYTLEHAHSVYGVAWSPDGAHIASYSRDTADKNFITTWDVKSGQPQMVRQFETDFGCFDMPSPCNMRWQNNTTILLITSLKSTQWDIQTGRRSDIPDDISRSWSSPKGNYKIEVSQNTRQVRVIETATKRTKLTVNLKKGMYDLVIWSQDDDHVLIQQHTEPDYLWDGSTIRRLERVFTVYQMDYAPESGLVVGTNLYSQGVIWDAKTGKKLKTPIWTGIAATFNPTGTLLAVAGTQTVTIWDMLYYLDSKAE